MELLIIAAIGIFTGILTGLFGIGGGSVRIPLLSFTGMPLINAFAINMVSILFASATGSVVQWKNVDKTIARFLILGGVSGAALATVLVGYADPLLLATIFLITSILTGLGLYLDRLMPKFSAKLKPSPKIFFGGGLLINFILGLRGGSGGSLFPPFLASLHVDMHRAIATSLLAGTVAATIASSIYIFRGEVLWIPSAVLIAGAVVGSLIGSRVSLNTQSTYLKAGLAILVFVLGALVFIRAF